MSQECVCKVLSSAWHIVESLQSVAIKNQVKTTLASFLGDATRLLHSLFHRKTKHLDFKTILFYTVPLQAECYHNTTRYMHTTYPHLTI